jgi:hypothetical protein
LKKKTYASWKAKSVSGPAVYYMGIVDFLQEWNLRKRMERAFKIYISRNEPQGISVMTPAPYRDRFHRKMEQIFDLDDPLGLFTERGEAAARTPSGRFDPFYGSLPSSAFEEAPRDTAADSSIGIGTVMNALHSSFMSAASTKSSSPQHPLYSELHVSSLFPIEERSTAVDVEEEEGRKASSL